MQLRRERPPRENLNREARDTLICASIEENPTQALSTVAREFDISASTARNVLRRHGYRPFKLRRGNEQFPADAFRRMEFCEVVMERANADPNFIGNILFTDESTFTLHGRHNSQNVRMWARENPRRIYAARTQYPQKLNVWAGILGDRIIGPFFINGNLNGARYLNLLRDQIVPALQNLDGVNIENVWFQQDGCPAHNTMAVREFLSDTFGPRLIMGRGGILWPARSPDLAPCDFFLWGYLKSKLYVFQEDRANNLNDLGIRITNLLGDISPEVLANVRGNFYNRLGYCLAAYGGLFEHLI